MQQVNPAESRISETSVARYLAVILILAGLLRISLAFYLGDSAYSWPVHDQDSYDALAQRVLAGKGFSFDRAWYPWVEPDTQTSYYSSTIVLYLAGIYAVFGHHPLAARIVTALMGTMACFLTYRLGRRLFGAQVGLIASALAAGYAYLAYYSAALMTEIPFITAILLALDTSVELTAKSTWTRWLRLGIALAIAVLLRMAVLPFVFVLLIWIYLRSEKRPSLVNILLPILIIIMAVAPWTYRNYRLYGRLMLLESQFGHVFWNGNHPDRDAGYHFEEAAWVAPLPQDISGLNEAEKTYALLQRGIQNVLANPCRFVTLSLSRARVMFTFWPESHSTTLSNISRVLSFGVLWPFMLYGLALSLRQWRRCMIIYLFIVIHLAVYLASWVLIRYRLPADAVALPFAALAISDLVGRIWKKTFVTHGAN